MYYKYYIKKQISSKTYSSLQLSFYLSLPLTLSLSLYTYICICLSLYLYARKCVWRSEQVYRTYQGMNLRMIGASKHNFGIRPEESHKALFKQPDIDCIVYSCRSQARRNGRIRFTNSQNNEATSISRTAGTIKKKHY